MENNIPVRGEKYIQKRKKMKRWQKVFSGLACLVVFCTTYALILPAITMTRTVQVLECPLAIHAHTAECYDEEENLICGEVDFVVHTHDEDCCDEDGNLVCQLPEVEEHEHTKKCYTRQKVLVCGLEEDEEHKHSGKCYEMQDVLTCEEPEIIVHKHNEDCLDEEGNLICGETQILEHIHGNGCFCEVEVEAEDEEEPEEETQPEEPMELDNAVILGNGVLPQQPEKPSAEPEAEPEQPAQEPEIQPEEPVQEPEQPAEEPQQEPEVPAAEEIPTELTPEQTEELKDILAVDGELVLEESFAMDSMLMAAPSLLAAGDDEANLIAYFNFNNENGVGYMGDKQGNAQMIVHDSAWEDGSKKVGNSGSALRILNSYNDKDSYVTITKKDGSSLLTGFNEISFDFWMYTEEKFNGNKGNIWPFYAAPNGNYQGNNPTYIGMFADSGGTSVTVERHNNGRKDFCKAAVTNGLQGKWRHVRVDFTNDEIVLNIWNEYGNTKLVNNLKVSNTESLEQILGSNSILQIGKANWVSGEYFNGWIDELKIYGSKTTAPIVWLDGTDGGLMNLTGAANVKATVTRNANGTYSVTLPTAAQWDGPDKYSYALCGWYDVYGKQYYQPGQTVTVSENTVFYADYRAATYNVGQANSNVIPDSNTSFIRTYVYDYSVLFNVQSTSVSQGSLDANGHRENWTLQQTGTNAYTGQNTLDFIFLDWDMSGSRLSMPANTDTKNYNQGTITSNILSDVKRVSGKDLLPILFPDPGAQSVIGVNYIGTGDNLFHYADSVTAAVTSRKGGSLKETHKGYYYYDSLLNAASYNQSAGRFYVYDYLERTSDSEKDSGLGEYSDFLPFNSPDVNNNGHTVQQYPYNGKTNYQYDAKDNGDGSRTGNAVTNYFFGIRTDVSFFLPNDVRQRINGEYGNRAATGDPMVFEFYGDDDVWIMVDGQLVMDVGGLHGVKGGTINFSTGEVITGDVITDEVITGEVIPELVTTRLPDFQAGEHTLTIYYMERGSSQSNCRIYFNLAPRYKLQLNKVDADDMTSVLENVTFSVFTDLDCTQYANVWNSETEHNGYATEAEANQRTEKTFTTDGSGQTECWGLAAGQTYYIQEVSPSTEDNRYGTPEDTICVTLDAQGKAKAWVIDQNGNRKDNSNLGVLNGEDHNISADVSSVTVTNKMTEVAQFRVEKQWSDNSGDRQEDIGVKLWQKVSGSEESKEYDTVYFGKADNWEYTWSNLPRTDANGNKYIYTVTEVYGAAGYSSSVGEVVYDSEYSAHVVITNTLGEYELPETGGMGTTLLYAVGGVLMMTAGTLLIIRRRMA